MNQWNLFNRDAGKAVSSIRWHHGKKFDGDMVTRAFGVIHQSIALEREKMEFLQTRHFDKDGITEFLDRIFPFRQSGGEMAVNSDGTPRKVRNDGESFGKKAILTDGLLETAPGQSEIRGSTWFKAFNSVTFYLDHIAGRNPDTRADSALFGKGATIKNKALNLALEMAA